MTITPIWECGFELGDAREEMTFTSGSTSNVSTLNVKTGTYAFSYAVSGINMHQEAPAAISQCQVGMHVYNQIVSGERRIFTLRDAMDADVLVVSWSFATSEWVIDCGATEVARVEDTVFAATAHHYHIGVDVNIDGTNGWVYLYRDGEAVVEFDGNTAQGGASFSRFRLSTATVAGGWSGTVDDIVWFDTTGEVSPAAVPDYRLYPLTPNGNGNYNEWDGSDGNAVNNYELVDEIPPNDNTDYVTTATDADTESFAMTTITIPDGFEVEEVIILAVARKEDGLGTLGLKLGTRLSSTDQIGSTQALGSDYTTYRERQDEKPGGGAWTQADIDGFEAVIEAAV